MKRRRRGRKGKKLSRSRRAARRGAKHIYVRHSRGRHAGKRIRRRVRRHRVKPYSYTRRGKRVHVKKHMSYEAGVMENPLTTSEVVVAGLIGIVGAMSASFVDRAIAGHALKGTIAADGSGLTDAPAQNQPYNVDAVAMPLDFKRAAAGLGLGIAPIVGAHFVRSPMVRTSLQSFGFGAIIRTGLKAGDDLLGWAFRKKSFGQRYYPAEIQAHVSAAALKAATSAAPEQGALPAVGSTSQLAGVPSRQLGTGGCSDCSKKQQMQQTQAPPPPPAGYGAPPAPYPSPPAPIPQPPPAAAHTNGAPQYQRFFNPAAAER